MLGYWTSIPVSVAIACVDTRAGIGYLLGYSLHRWCSNDWDIMGVTGDEGRMVNELPILGHFLYGISSAYGSIFRKYHRSFISHFPYVSTVIRLMFIFIIPFVVGDGYGINFIGNGWVWFWVNLWLGLSHADGIHLYLDIFPKEE